MIDTNNGRTPLRIRVFGRFEVMVDGEPLKPNRPNDLHALAYLILHHDSQVDRTTIATSCWKTDKPVIFDENPRQYLTKAVYELRVRLNLDHEWLRKPTSQALLFDSTGVELDLLEWERALADGGVEALEQAAHYLTDALLLEGWDDDWVLETRARFRCDYLSRLRVAALLAEDLADWKSAIRCCTLAIDIEPFDQHVLCDFLILLCKRRQYTRMSCVYEEFLERAVQAQVDIDPETRSLYRGLQGEVDQFKSSGENGSLPAPIPAFIARPDDVQQVCDLVKSARLTTLTGAGGIGKTRLCIASVERLNDGFYDRAWFVDLSEVSDPEDIPLKLCRCLHALPKPDASQTQSLCSVLMHRQSLIVLDNCEHLIDGCATIAAAILESCKNVRILATSREPLDIFGEMVWRVPSMAVPAVENSSSPDMLLGFSSVQLLVERASRPQVPFIIDKNNAESVARICRRLDGIPLAIELAAVQIDRNSFSPHEAADSLDNSLRFLTQGSKTAPSRHQTLRATIAWSYDMLDETEKAVFERISVFAGGFTEGAVKHVCTDRAILEDKTVAVLHALVQKSLVETRIAHGGGKRYHLLQTIHDFAAEQFSRQSAPTYRSTTDEVDTIGNVERRHLDYFLGLVEETERSLSGPEQVRMLDRLEAEHENICAALGWALAHGHYEAGLRLCSSAAWYFNTRDHKALATKWLIRFLQKSEGAQAEHRIKALRWAGNIAYSQGNCFQARGYFVEALELRRGSDDTIGIANCQASLANALGGLGERVKAIELLESSLAIFVKAERWRNAAQTYTNMGILAYKMAEYERAVDLHRKGLDLVRKVDDVENEVLITTNLVGALFKTGDVAAVRASLPETLTLCVKLKSDRRLANCLMNYIALARVEGDWESGAIIHGFLERLMRRIEYVLSPESQAVYDTDSEMIRNGVEGERFHEMTVRGARMSQQALVDMLLSAYPRVVPPNV